ncbi:MAG: SDR family NAD(P)-dependent oxidoreductase [Clostridiales bacterium]|jgi:NAD(P)-dependent dehydrogenase (short-subunit alcohol dehydrogenase family)|nr:SDR family NAD(P)-dependent oxidoreductase [Clostridiales bacterium]
MGKTALISGTSRGLGIALVEIYLRSGWSVFAGARDISGPNLKALKETYKDALTLVEMDISSTESVKAAAKLIKESAPTLNVIINNAATSDREGAKPIEEMDVDACLRVYNVNALGALRVIQAFLDYAGEGGLSVIANISSEAGSMENCHRDSGMDYAMSKAALNMGSVLVQRRLKDKKMKILSIHPGWVQSRPAPPKADFEPLEAALNIYNTINSFDGTVEGPVFINHDGNPMAF